MRYYKKQFYKEWWYQIENLTRKKFRFIKTIKKDKKKKKVLK